MKLTRQQIELIKVEDDRAYFEVLGYEYTFECAFNYETENHKAELDYGNGTGQLECTEVVFIDVSYISYLYESDNSVRGGLDVKKADLEDMIKEHLEYNLND
jgi:hypothetical protein